MKQATDQRMRHVGIERVNRARRAADGDLVAVEEPLEIRIGDTPLAVTMRTPGHDEELAAGFLYTEGLIDDADAILHVAHCRAVPAEAAGNVVTVTVADEATLDLERVKRNFYATSSCGICGKASIEQVNQRVSLIASNLRVPARLLSGLSEAMSAAQEVFGETGGLHACGLFTAGGELRCLREDVGRHNAVDKAVGWALLGGHLPLEDAIMMVSGRASFEIVQKALMARIPLVAAVSAPSSLAVELAERCDMTLVGFLRNGRMNVYTAPHRVV